MADLKQIEAAFLKADAAGDTDAAKVLAGEVRRLRAEAGAAQAAPEPSLMSKAGQAIGNVGAGLVRGAGSIGATILAPVDAAARALGVQNDFIGRTDRREGMDGGLQALGADPKSFAYQAGKLGGEVAGTAGAGGVLARGAAAIPGVAARAPGFINALRTSGMTAGQAPGISNALTRAAGGALSGAASGALIDPSEAGTGAMVGAALPATLQVAGKAGNAIGSALRGGGASPEVQALAARAKALGIDIPADRLVDSKPLNAVASALNYVPLSGRAGTEATMERQLNQAASRLVGQDTPNMTKALRDASADLGAKFDATLQGNSVQMTPNFRQGLADVENRAAAELSAADAAIIHNQIAQLQTKGAAGAIDGQTAYNIKKTLDAIGRRNSNESFYARDLKGVLMDALNESLGPQEAAAFAKTREQYSNMLALQKLAKNGAEGDISVARLANLGNINNKPLQEIADIAAQFVKPRESQHGAMQRAVVGLAGAVGGGIPGLATGVTAGRATNAALNSNAVRQFVMGQPNGLQRLAGPEALLYRSAPAIAADR